MYIHVFVCVCVRAFECMCALVCVCAFVCVHVCGGSKLHSTVCAPIYM